MDISLIYNRSKSDCLGIALVSARASLSTVMHFRLPSFFKEIVLCNSPNESKLLPTSCPSRTSLVEIDRTTSYQTASDLAVIINHCTSRSLAISAYERPRIYCDSANRIEFLLPRFPYRNNAHYNEF